MSETKERRTSEQLAGISAAWCSGGRVGAAKHSVASPRPLLATGRGGTVRPLISRRCAAFCARPSFLCWAEERRRSAHSFGPPRICTRPPPPLRRLACQASPMAQRMRLPELAMMATCSQPVLMRSNHARQQHSFRGPNLPLGRHLAPLKGTRFIPRRMRQVQIRLLRMRITMPWPRCLRCSYGLAERGILVGCSLDRRIIMVCGARALEPDLCTLLHT